MLHLRADDVLDRAIGLALGIAVGDAKGIAYENLTRQQVKNLQNERASEFNENEVIYAKVSGNNPYIPHDWPQGRWTDDTQLSLAMMRAITKFIQGGDLINHIVNEHINEWKESIDGWGGTKTAIERLVHGTHTYIDSGNLADGNGVLMKLAPLAFFYWICGKVNDNEIERICRMTHTSPVALATACIFVHLYVYLFQQTVEPIDFLQYSLQLARKYETKHALVEQKQLLSQRIQRYLDALLSSTLDDDVLIDVSNGGTFYCVDSLAMVIGLVAISPKGRPDFEKLVKAAEIGGDTDSNAAMIGALVGGTRGETAIDIQHTANLYRSNYVRDIGEQFGMGLVEYANANLNME